MTKRIPAETAAERAVSPSEAAGLRGAKARRRRRLAGKEPGRPWPARRQARKRVAVPQQAKGDKREAEARACRLPEPRRETRRGQKHRPLEAVGSRSHEGRPQGCRSAGGRQGAGLAPAAWQPKAPGGRNKTRGAGPAPKARGRRRIKNAGFFFQALNNREILHRKYLPLIFAPPAAECSFRRRRPDGLWSRVTCPAHCVAMSGGDRRAPERHK